MTKKQFGQITDKIEAVYRPKCPDGFTDLQFEEWWQTFGGEEYGVALRAYEKMKKEYGYFPMISTFQSYIKGIKEIDESIQKKSSTLKLGEPTPQDLNRHLRWMRFISWTYETRKFPKTSEEAFAMKAKFEKEYPDWKRKERVVTNKPEMIGQILK